MKHELKEELSEAWERLDRLHNSGDGLRGAPTGFADLDNKLSGLQKSDLIILAARPSVGKTSLMKYFSAITNRPFYRINFNGSMDSSSILGTNSASAGTVTWHDGFLTEAIQIPNAIVGLDEWTVCPPEIILLSCTFPIAFLSL